MKYLGIDFGVSHLGLAVSDGEIAEPLKTNSKISQIIKTYQIEQIVIGVTDGKIGDQARIFGEKLKNASGLPVYYQNEDMTSLRAVSQMVQSGKRKSLRQTMDHAVAAANILQDFLNDHENKL